MIDVAENWNRSYYGMAVLPPDIPVRATAQGDRLAAELGRASARQRTSMAQ